MAIVINSTTGEIDLDQTAPGTYVVTYTVQGVSSTQEVTVNAVDNAGFSYSASSYEPTDADPTPTITGLTGGTFSGTTGLVINSTTGEIDLSASTVATHTITYDTTSSGSSVCPNTSTQTVEIALAGIANNYSMSFDGVNDFIQSTSSIISGNIDRTVSLWYKMNGSLTTRDTLMTLGVDSDATPTKQRFGISIQGSQRIRAFIYVGDPDFNNTYNWGSIDLLDGNWHHVVLSYSNNNYKLYVDNTHIGTITPSPSHTLNTSDGITIGGNWLGSSVHEPINASVDEVGIWDTELTSTQIAEIYNATSTNLTKDLTTVSGSNLIYWNRMGD